MAEVLHKTPCNECPWRRSHMPGWLGGYAPEDFVNQVQFDGPPLPCHKTIRNGQEATAHCAGALIFMRNSCKSAQHPDYGDALEQVEPDREAVFHFPSEFLEHHRRDLGEWAKERMAETAENPVNCGHGNPVNACAECDEIQERHRQDADDARFNERSRR